MNESSGPGFEQAFRARARSVLRWLFLRQVLGGAAFGALFGALITLILWWQRAGTLRPWALLVGLMAGVTFGLFRARQTRWSEPALALYLDARLGTAEAIATAAARGATDAHRHAEGTALRALREAAPGRLRPPVLSRLHALLPLGSAGAVFLCLIPLPAAPPLPPPGAGAEHVTVEDLAGLERIEALAKLGGADPEQEERLKALAEQARKLRADLGRGLEKREALSRLGALRDAITAEKQRFGDAKNRAGLDAASSDLEREKLTNKAGRALGEGDLTRFDAEMQRLASLAEKEARDAAREALDSAIRSAREKGSQALAETLERERAAFAKNEAKNEALRELARRLQGSLDSEGQEALGELNRSGDPEAQRRLAEALERALRGLSEEERRRLAENLRRDLERSEPGDGASADMEELLKRLERKGSERELEEYLRELARRDPSDDARRERGLGDADRGGAEAERGLGVPMPLGGGHPGQNQNGQPRQEQPQAGNPEGGPGAGRDEGQGDHSGKTEPLDLGELRAKAKPELLPGMPMHRAALGHAPGRAGETASEVGTGALGVAGPAEVGAVEGADIPEEYREQVGRYFEP